MLCAGRRRTPGSRTIVIPDAGGDAESRNCKPGYAEDRIPGCRFAMPGMTSASVEADRSRAAQETHRLLEIGIPVGAQCLRARRALGFERLRRDDDIGRHTTALYQMPARSAVIRGGEP